MNQVITLRKQKQDGSFQIGVGNGLMNRIESWVQTYKAITYPAMFIILLFAFTWASAPWVNNYQTMKEAERVHTSLASFSSLYWEFAQTETIASTRNPMVNANVVWEEMQGWMEINNVVSPTILNGVEPDWMDDYYVIGNSVKILLRPVSYEACAALNGSQNPRKGSLAMASMLAIAKKSADKPGCYIQAWTGVVPNAFKPYVNDENETPMSFIVLGIKKTSPKASERSHGSIKLPTVSPLLQA